MTWGDVLDVIGAPEAALLLGVAALVFRSERRFRRMVNRIVGDGDRLGALDRLDQIERSLAAVQLKFEPDHGGSFHDALVRVDERTARIEKRLDDHLLAPHPRR